MIFDIKDMKEIQLVKQKMHNRPSYHEKDILNSLIARIGLIQLDSINVCGRSQDLFFWSRFCDYKANDYLKLYDDVVAEIYSYALTLVASNSYLREMLHQMYKNKLFSSEHAESALDFYNEITPKLPESQNLLVSKEGKKNWALSHDQQLIDKLWRAGLIDVARDSHFKKIIMLPQKSNRQIKYDIAKHYKELILITFENLGIANLTELSNFFKLKKSLTEEILSSLLQSNEISEVYVKDLGTHFIKTTDLNILETEKQITSSQVILLSPFDNLIRDRARTLKIFEIDYRLESYVPSEKRRYGYYALPIMINGLMVGTIDLKINKKNSSLDIHKTTYFHPNGCKLYSESIEDALEDLRKMLNLTSVHGKKNLKA